LSGHESVVAASADNLWPFDINAKGNLLASGNTWALSLKALAPGARTETDISWLDSSNYPSVSFDGKEMIFTEESPAAGNNYALLLRRMDGSSPLRLGEGVAMGLSPDNSLALSMMPNSPSRLVLYPTGAGEQRILEQGPIERYEMARFFPDGKRVLACGNEAGHSTRCYVQEIAGGPPRPITPEGTSDGRVSHDGKSVLVQGTDGHYLIYPVGGGPVTPVPWLASDERVLSWTEDGRGVIAFQRSQIPAQVFSVNLTTGRREKVGEFASADLAGTLQILNASVSADAKSYAYTYLRNVSRLVAIKGVK
jgi:Tol biopolymer transport system component